MRFVACAVVAIALSMASAANGQDTAIRSLVERFEAARLQHDPASLMKTLAPNYEEISPIGEVDPRAKVLGFYAPELKRSAPPMRSDEVVIHSRGDVAIITMRKSFVLPGATPRSVRVRYVAQRSAGAWQMVSAQYTPIPIAKSS